MDTLRDRIHIWQVAYDAAEASGPAFKQMLDPAESKKADRFRFEHDRLAYIHARGALRSLLGWYTRQSPDQVRFRLGPDGKPSLAMDAGGLPICFNLSHTKGLALVAVTRGVEVGVDVEAVCSIPERAEIVKSHFSDQETQQFHPDEHDDAFFGCWTRKEAVLKAVGTGLMRPLHTFGILPDKQRPAWYRVVGDCPQAGRWRVHSFTINPGYVGAVAVADGYYNPLMLTWKGPGSLEDTGP